jgi:cytochrome b
MKDNAVYVWDPLVRIFHWSLVLFFTLAYLTEDDFMQVHEFAGYAVLGLVGFRVVWGLVGTRYARFSNFIYGFDRIKSYLVSLARLKPQHYIGHNPAGGLMVIIMLVMLALTSWSGIKAGESEATEQASASPAIKLSLVSSAYADDDEHEKRNKGDEFWEDIHEALANFTLFLVFLHITGVIVSSVLHREKLVRAMITGYKERKE